MDNNRIIKIATDKDYNLEQIEKLAKIEGIFDAIEKTAGIEYAKELRKIAAEYYDEHKRDYFEDLKLVLNKNAKDELIEDKEGLLPGKRKKEKENMQEDSKKDDFNLNNIIPNLDQTVVKDEK
jgi:hypothetical protein